MSKAMKLSLLFALSLSASVAQAQTALIPKQLSGPPEEFAQMRAPDPAQSAVISRSALLPIELSGKSAAAISLPVENGKLRFALFSGGADWQPELASPSGQPLIVQKMASGAKATRLGLDGNAYPATEYTLEGLQRGQWTLTLRPAHRLAKSSQAQRGYVLMEGEASTELASYPTHRRQWVGNSLGFTAVLSGSAQKAIVQNSTVLGAAAGRIQRGSLRVIAPDGSESRWPMSDDGRRGDAIARDGIYGGTFTPSATGTYVVQVVVNGIDRDGAAFVRTAEHVVPVIAPGLKLGASKVGAVSAGGTRMSLGIPVAGNLDPARRYRVFAEVWGRGADGRQVPVAWIGGMASAKGRQLPLGLDQRWIQRAGARAPFSLRNVRIEDADYFIPVASAGSLSLALPDSVATLTKRSAVIDESMVMGPRPALIQTKAGAGSRLILVHGYCSGGVWPQSQFTNASAFLDANQNRSHDQFAQLLKNYGSTWNSFGTVAHSQGGAAALHLYAYYWSGLDNATGNRLMQSVGTPYQGTNLSGIIATVGSWFGVACGSNYDMTYDGASAWLAGIPSWARAKVNYYTTSFKSTNWWTNDYCNFASDLVLSDPEDGTTEKAYGQLPGALNQGHVTGQCHTTGMRDPAQYLDAGRNGVMNSNAAR